MDLIENKSEENIFKTAFVNIMNFLKVDRHTLFQAIEMGMDFYAAHRIWTKLEKLTEAWAPWNQFGEFKKKRRRKKKNYEFDGLEENIYETAFGNIMSILSATNHWFFNDIAVMAHVLNQVDEEDTQDREKIEIAHAWKLYCDQNTCVAYPDEYEKFQNKSYP